MDRLRNREISARRDQSALFDPDQLKNGNQMLASEGVNATMVYRWLVSGADDRESLVARYSRMFSAIRATNDHELTPDARCSCISSRAVVVCFRMSASAGRRTRSPPAGANASSQVTARSVGRVGPDLWLLVDCGQDVEAVTVNLNTAEIEDLLQLPGIDRNAVERALTSRRATGAFTDVRDFIARGGFDQNSAESVEQAARTMTQTGTYLRR